MVDLGSKVTRATFRRWYEESRDKCERYEQALRDVIATRKEEGGKHIYTGLGHMHAVYTAENALRASSASTVATSASAEQQ
jgi:hypothetical protein